jgi:hypothetical protein
VANLGTAVSPSDRMPKADLSTPLPLTPAEQLAVFTDVFGPGMALCNCFFLTGQGPRLPWGAGACSILPRQRWFRTCSAIPVQHVSVSQARWAWVRRKNAWNSLPLHACSANTLLNSSIHEFKQALGSCCLCTASICHHQGVPRCLLQARTSLCTKCCCWRWQQRWWCWRLATAATAAAGAATAVAAAGAGLQATTITPSATTSPVAPAGLSTSSFKRSADMS